MVETAQNNHWRNEQQLTSDASCNLFSEIIISRSTTSNALESLSDVFCIFSPSTIIFSASLAAFSIGSGVASRKKEEKEKKEKKE